MHKVPGIASINRKHTPPLLFSFYKICSFCDSSLPTRSHEVLPYCLALFLFCDPADMDRHCMISAPQYSLSAPQLKYFLVQPRGYSLEFTRYRSSFDMARETREIVVRVRNDPVANLRSKNSILKNFQSLTSMAPRKG